MPPSIQAARAALTALREEFARRAAHEAAIAAENSTKYTRDITKAPAYVERAWAPAPQPQLAQPVEVPMLQGLYRGYAGEQQPAVREFFLTPQQRVADFYAKKRSAQMGAEPHVDMVLIPQDAGEVYGHGTIGMPEWGYPDPMFTAARRKIAPEDIKARTQLYAHGGLAQYKECNCGR